MADASVAAHPRKKPPKTPTEMIVAETSLGCVYDAYAERRSSFKTCSFNMKCFPSVMEPLFQSKGNQRKRKRSNQNHDAKILSLQELALFACMKRVVVPSLKQLCPHGAFFNTKFPRPSRMTGDSDNIPRSSTYHPLTGINFMQQAVNQASFVYRASHHVPNTLFGWPVEYIRPNAKHRSDACGEQSPNSSRTDGISLSAPFTSIVFNATQTEAIVTVADRLFAVPPNSMFMLCDLVEAATRGAFISLASANAWSTKEAESRSGLFELIVADPPWQNRSIKRGRQYRTMGIGSPSTRRRPRSTGTVHSMLRMDMASLAAPGALLVIWCTNDPRVHAFAKSRLVPQWGFEYITTWYWLKVTESGKPVFPFPTRAYQRRPFEPFILARFPVHNNNQLRVPVIPRIRVVCSVPSFHSFKPQLDELLRPYKVVPVRPITARRRTAGRCPNLELFARMLRPGFAAMGDECLRFQDIGEYYQESSNSVKSGVTEI